LLNVQVHNCSTVTADDSNASKQPAFELLIMGVKIADTVLYYNCILKFAYSQFSLNTHEAAQNRDNLLSIP
jgi:hypothetical protein